MIKVRCRDKEWEVPANITVREIIRRAGLNPEAVLAMKDGKLINDTIIVPGGAEITLVVVVSGG
jgi:sulfur carrier protein ThiS